MWGLVRQLSGKRARRGPRALAVLEDKDGLVALTRLRQEQTWAAHFLTDFGVGAFAASFEDIRSHVDIVRAAWPPPAVFPSHAELASKLGDAVLACKHGKAVGNDQIPIELLKSGGRWVNSHLANLMLLSARDGLPLAFRGDRMAPVPRKPGRPLSISNGRGVSCGSAVAKPMGRVLRRELRASMCQETVGWQAGGIPHGSTEAPAHTASLLLSWARQTHCSAACLFTDVRAAFYSAWPELVLGPLLQPHQRASLFEAAGLSQEGSEFVTGIIMSPDKAFQRRGVSEFWQRFAADWHIGNFFTVGTDPTPYQTWTGTRPGDPVADLIFVMFFGIQL
jgi:hypothetical protein